MTPASPHILQVLTGTVAPLGAAGKSSAIAKQPVSGPVAIGPLGLHGDAQADVRVHGGPDKAVHLYAWPHYAAWRSELGAAPVLQAPGAFGENLAVAGLDEAGVCIGDHWRAGSAVLEVTQGRQPCWKLNLRFGHKDMARRLQDTGRTGWYWRVLEPGQLQAGDAIHLVERPHPAWTLARVVDLLYHRPLDREALQGLARLHLPPSWQRIVQGRLERGQVEDWARRMQG